MHTLSDSAGQSSCSVIRSHAVLFLNPAARIMASNEAAEALYGYSASELIERPLSALFHMDADRQAVTAAALEALNDGDSVEFEALQLRKNGDRFWSTVVVSPRYENAERVGYLAISRALANRGQVGSLLRSVLDNALDGIISIDGRGTVQSFNRAAERIFGYIAPEVIGRNINMLMPEPYRSEHDGYVANYLRTGNAKIIGIGRDVTGLRKDGSTFPMDLAVSEFDLDGARHFTGIVRDTTHTKTLESQFRQAQKMEAIGRLAGGVAHDFNNLLTVMAGYGETLLLELPQGDGRRRYATEIVRAAERAATLTSQLLAFSRQSVLQPKVIEPGAVIADLSNMLTRLIGEDIKFATTFAADTPLICVDPGQLSQVLMNLVINARDAMPRGGKLTIETHSIMLTDEYLKSHLYAKAGRHALIAVTDTGCGMSPEVRNQIFEPFFTTKGAGRGTGLGLATVYGIIKQSGGLIEVYSEPGLGSTFKVYFPAAQAPEKSILERADPRPTRGVETLLLVEDEDAVREIAMMALKQQGYRVLSAANASEALNIAADQPNIDLLVTDVVMPERSGRELAERLRTERKGLRVLFLSGYTDDAVVRHGILQANAAFLQKPFTPATLARKVREVLDQT